MDAPRTLAASFVAAAGGAFGFGLLLGLELAGVRLGPWGAAAACLACGGLAVGGAWALPHRLAGGARRAAVRGRRRQVRRDGAQPGTRRPRLHDRPRTATPPEGKVSP
jgi:hypothetical protein